MRSFPWRLQREFLLSAIRVLSPLPYQPISVEVTSAHRPDSRTDDVSSSWTDRLSEGPRAQPSLGDSYRPGHLVAGDYLQASKRWKCASPGDIHNPQDIVSGRQVLSTKGREAFMFPMTFAGKVAADSWINVHAIPQDLIEGVITTFVGLVILFSIKPRLKIRLEPEKRGTSAGNDSGQQPSAFCFKVTNRRLRKVVELEARLLCIHEGGMRREEIELTCNKLFELRGKWSPLKPSLGSLLRARAELLRGKTRRATVKDEIDKCRAARDDDRTKKALFGFRPVAGKLEHEIGELSGRDFILFQVIARDAFTGSSRLKTQRFSKSEFTDRGFTEAAGPGGNADGTNSAAGRDARRSPGAPIVP